MLRGLLDNVAALAGYVPKPDLTQELTTAQEYVNVAQTYLSSTGQAMRQMINSPAPPVMTEETAEEMIKVNQDKIFSNQTEFTALYGNEGRWNSEAAITFLETTLELINQCSLAISGATVMISPVCDGLNSISSLLCSHQRGLTLYKEMCQENLEERLIFLKRHPETEQIISEIQKDLPQHLVRERYKYAYIALCDQALAAKLTPDALLSMLDKFKNKGIGSSAGKALHEAVCAEVLRRIAEDSILENNPHIESMRQFFKSQSNSRFEERLEKVIADKQNQKAQAFKRIYQALCEAQKTLNSSKFLKDKMDWDAPKLLAEIEKTVASDPRCTAAIAHALTKKYFNHVSENNFELVNDLVQIGLERSNGLAKLVERKYHLTRQNFEQEKNDPKSLVRLICLRLEDHSHEKVSTMRPS